MNPKNFKVGQPIYFLSSSNKREMRPMVICSIGRKWVTASRDGSTNGWPAYRFAPPNMRADGGTYQSPGLFVLDLEAYQASMEANAAWLELRRMLRDETTRPEHLTAERIKQITSELKGAPQ